MTFELVAPDVSPAISRLCRGFVCVNIVFLSSPFGLARAERLLCSFLTRRCVGGPKFVSSFRAFFEFSNCVPYLIVVSFEKSRARDVLQ